VERDHEDSESDGITQEVSKKLEIVETQLKRKPVAASQAKVASKA